MIGRIQLLQELLGLPLSTHEELCSCPREQLATTMNELQAKLRLRRA